jgi:hypothetical protein
LKDLLTRLEHVSAQIDLISPSLAGHVRQLNGQVNNHGQADQAGFRTRVAYALQDVEKLAGPVQVSSALREELSRLATTVPGLQNERMQELLKATPSIADRPLTNDIRSTAGDIARQPLQNTPDIESRVDALENRARLAPHVATVQPTPSVTASSKQSAPGSDDKKAPLPGTATQEPAQEAGPRPTPPPYGPRHGAAQSQVAAKALFNIVTALGGPTSATQLPWDGPQDSIADRHTTFEQKMNVRREDQTLKAAEKAGQTAFSAMQEFREGAGAGILNKIQDAARATPGGMPAVLSEMRDGGRFAGLREQFNAALSTEKGVSAGYDHAVAALGRYGEQRTGIEQLLARRSDAASLTGKFEKLDAEIGNAASLLPGRKDGRSALDELSDKASEILSKAVEAIRGAFNRAPRAETSTNPSPSPSVSP